MKKKIKNALREVYWAFHGKRLTPPLPISRKSILYVCKGNICRSPFAERLTIKMVKKQSSDLLMIGSAGINATITNPPPKEAMDAAKTFGISMDDHRAQCLTKELINGTEMIVVMEVEHLKQLEEIHPGSINRCFLLSMFFHDQRHWGNYYFHNNITDPLGVMLTNSYYAMKK
jgi:protein-tyrosine phosphatase